MMNIQGRKLQFSSQIGKYQFSGFRIGKADTAWIGLRATYFISAAMGLVCIPFIFMLPKK